MIVYTTVMGRTDPLREPLNPGGVRFVCFTDQPLQSQHWEIVRVPVTDTPNREHHRLKQLSHIALPEADASLWIDAAFLLHARPLNVLAKSTHDVMGFKHPDRTRISQEALAIVRANKGRASDINAQLNAYQAHGWDTDDNPQQHITNGGFLLRRHTPEVKKFNEAWHREVQQRSLRDQMSIDFVAHQCGVAIGHFEGTVRKNAFATLHVMPGKKTTDF